MFSLTLKTGLKTLTAAMIGIASFQACADVVISGTRIVYQQSMKDVIVNLDNRGKNPLLLQIWLDDGSPNVNPQELKLPFVITPPISRIDPGKGQSVRVTYLQQPLPQDRESLFWFNVLEIPKKATAKDGESQNQLQLAFRTRIKLFFRPDGLKGTPGEAMKQVKWSQTRQGNTLSLVGRNDSPYNVSLSSATFKVGAKEYEIDSKSIKPFSSETMTVKGLTNNASGEVVYIAINDFGGTEKLTANVN
ncbi:MULTISPECIES: fimbrial chaperone [Citrobacter]|uniref:Putative chaperone protein EcpD n=1 Tax=Citrobacter koseri TaxID=545 RepID=A0A078LHX0_CITKO|nr:MULTISPECIES: fimbrial chaperone [Citrobacter]AVE61049.1 fimbrial chaperone [Citrobacter koseri]EKU0540347.1 fimbrial chaperone [Citrobacter koseri]EKU8894700.1 fimbrial chaperone [Citrobacter koseri]EKW5657227.1 fimbrial chaperone [Citrobacter koseri]ELO4691561.1 fimbrial chaperone [Citrobacter koseri]